MRWRRRERSKRGKEEGRRFNKKLGLWFYRKIQFCVEYEAGERDLEVIKVDPRGASSTCPRCGGKLVEYEHRVLRCGKCGFTGDRDVVATINLYKKYVLKCSRCEVPGVAPSAPEPDEDPSGMRGNKGDAMKTHQVIRTYM